MSTTNAMSDYLEAQIMRHLFRNTAIFVPPATVYLALYTGGTLVDAGTGATEVAGNGYARVAMTTGASGTGVGSAWTDPGSTSGQTTNVANADFPIAITANWGTVTAWALLDASSGGNILFYGDVTPNEAINVNDIFRFLATQLSITVS